MYNVDRRFLNWIFEFASAIAILTLAGDYLDKKFGTSPNILSTALLLGFLLEGWNLYKIIKDSTKGA